jgi:cell wall-associated NlpC family hydrolase
VESRARDRITARVVQLALESIGTPYEWGGSDANGFDCSGLIQFAYGRFGIRVPRTSTAQMRAGSSVEPEPDLLRPGDVLGFSTGSGPASHVGLYIGEGEFIHSSSSGVRVSTLRSTYWRESLVAARRLVE